VRYYTSAGWRGDDLLLREIEDGERKQHVFRPEFSLFLSDPSGGHKTIDGKRVREERFPCLSAAQDYIKANKRKGGVYGCDRWYVQVLNEMYPGVVEYDPAKISVAYIDIEVASDEGFPQPDVAEKPVTAIAVVLGQTTYVFGCGNFFSEDRTVLYKKCRDERELLESFLHFWETDHPDVVSGWNIEQFDIPYLINRMRRLKISPTRLSPWHRLSQRRVMSKGEEVVVMGPVGVAVLDYMRLYKKFTYEPRESYSLNHICTVELGEKKIDYSEFESLLDLYQRDHQKFIEYNVHDTRLVARLEQRMRLIELAMKIAYDSKINFEDVLASSRPWDALIHNHLAAQNIVVPLCRSPQLDAMGRPIKKELVGGYVKDPEKGSYDWVVSFDVKSEYPHVIMQCNISPDSFVKKLGNVETEDFLEGRFEPFVEKLRENDWVMAANGCAYERDKIGFLPELMEHFFAERQKFAKIEEKLEEEYERSNGDPVIKAKISKYTNFQMATKIMLNSAFGCLSNPYFRWFSDYHAEAITTTGRLVIRWAERVVNRYINSVLGTTDVDYVIAIDTDSIYLHMGPLVRRAFGAEPSHEQALDFIDAVCEEKLSPLLEVGFENLARLLNAPSNRIVMKREAICDKAIWLGAKNYALSVLDNKGVRYAQSRLKIKGIKAVKPSTPEACRRKIEEALRMIVSGDETGLQNLTEDFRKEFESLPFEEIAFPRNISGLKTFGGDDRLYRAGTPIQVRAALVYNAMLRHTGLTSFPPIYDGDKVKFCYLSLPNPTTENVIAVPSVLPRQLGLEKYVDRPLQFQKAFLDPLRSIMEAVGWKSQEAGSLAEFF
jgi:Kyanoviridae DNA polymerase